MKIRVSVKTILVVSMASFCCQAFAGGVNSKPVGGSKKPANSQNRQIDAAILKTIQDKIAELEAESKGPVSKCIDSDSSKPVFGKKLHIEEDEGIEGGTYIRPNERLAHYFQAPLEEAKGGTLISVGTFRTLINAGMGNFDRVVHLDYDKTTTEFNRLHLALIAALGKQNPSSKWQRYQYLAALHCHWLTEDELHKLSVKEGSANGPLSDSFISTFDSFLEQGKACDYKKFPPQIGEVVREFQTRKLPGFDHSVRITDGFLGGYYDIDMARPSFYWENDADWAKIQKLVHGEDRAIAIVGNLLGGKAMKSLGESLRSRGETVSIVDTSNALEAMWHYRSSPESSEYGQANSEYLHFIENMKSLPLQPGAKVLRTTRNEVPGAPREWSYWSYIWLKATEFVNSSPKLEDWFAPYAGKSSH
jgi:hypothetical protein